MFVSPLSEYTQKLGASVFVSPLSEYTEKTRHFRLYLLPLSNIYFLINKGVKARQFNPHKARVFLWSLHWSCDVFESEIERIE